MLNHLNAIGNLNAIGRRRAGVSKTAAPLNLAASVVDEVSIALTWDAVTGADSYKIYYGTDGVTFGNSTTSATNSKTVAGLTAGILYYFYVVTVVGSSESIASNLSNEVTYSTFEMQSIQPATISQVVFTYSIIVPGDIWLDWGNGTVVKLDTGQNLTKTSNYATNNTTYDIKIYGALYHLDTFKIINTTCITNFLNFSKFLELYELEWSGSQTGSSGNFNNLPRSLRRLTLKELRLTVSGSFSSLPPDLEYLYFDRMYALTDDLAQLPSQLKWLRLSSFGSTPITYSLSGMPRTIQSLYLYARVLNGSISDLPPGLVLGFISADTNNVNGDGDDLPMLLSAITLQKIKAFITVNNMPSTLSYMYVSAVDADYISVSSDTIPSWGNTQITIQAVLQTAEIDLFLNTWEDTCGTGAETINLAGSTIYANQPRSSASDAAVADMQTNKLKTFVFNT